jgi:Domain of unknown function (DUF4272)
MSGWTVTVSVPAPDPHRVRAASIDQLRRLELPLPPAQFPLVWEPGDTVGLRPIEELEGRTAILNVVLARCFGMPGEAAMGWLLDAHLLESLTKPEWSFVASGEGDHRSFALHLEALYALAWLLGLVPHLDPTEPAPDGLVGQLPHLPSKETFTAWRTRTAPERRPASEAAIVLDLFYCLDWAYLQAERRRVRLPGLIDSNAIGQRRWALEWSVVLQGPYQAPPCGWEEVDLST